MVTRSKKKKVSSSMDELFSSDFHNGGVYEEFDAEIFNLMEKLEMQATMNSIETQRDLGQLDSDGKNFVATFTEEGSSAVQSMSYANDSLFVTFRKSPDMSYQYMLSDTIRKQIYDEVISTLVDGEGSVGRKIQNLISTNQIHLV
jgi:hypothetical protein